MNNHLSLPDLMMLSNKEVKKIAPIVSQAFQSCAFAGQEDNISLPDIEDALMHDLMHITLANPTDFYILCMESVCAHWAQQAQTGKATATVGLKDSAFQMLEKIFNFKSSENVYLKTQDRLEKWEMGFMKEAKEPIKTSKTLECLKRVRTPVDVKAPINYLNKKTTTPESKIIELADKLFPTIKPTKK